MFEYRSWELSTVKGAAKATSLTTIAVLSLGAGLLLLLLGIGPDWWWVQVALVIAGAAALVLVIGPTWFYTIWDMRADLARRNAEIRAITPRVRLAEIELEAMRERTRLADTLSEIDSDRIQFVLDTLNAPDMFTIEGQRVTWFINGVAIPPTFALEWLEKKAARGDGNQLPASRDWEGHAERDTMRRYNAALTDHLVRQGVALPARGNIPPEWHKTVSKERRLQALRIAGVWTAASWARLALGEAEDDIKKDGQG